MSKIYLIGFIVISIIISVYLVSQKTIISPKAAVDDVKNIVVSNISDSSITVSWITEIPTIGFIKYSIDSSYDKVEYDLRDNGQPVERKTHFVVLKNLLPETNYFIKVGEKIIEQKTSQVFENAPALPVLVYGKLINQNAEVPSEALVYIRLYNSTTLATYTNEGKWVITASNAKTSDLTAYADVKDGEPANIWVDGDASWVMNIKQITINSSKSVDDLFLNNLSGNIGSGNVGLGDDNLSLEKESPKIDTKSDNLFMKFLNWVKGLFT